MMLMELTRRLQDSDPQVRYILTYLYEAFNEQQKQLNMLSNIAQKLAEHDEIIIGQLTSFGRVDGVEVSSVAPDPEKGEVD